ncbi:MAG: VIT domain-containing protein [Phycisphaerae bacterium]
MKSLRIGVLVFLAVATAFAVHAGCAQKAPLRESPQAAGKQMQTLYDTSRSPGQYGFQPAPVAGLPLFGRLADRLVTQASPGALPFPGEELWVIQRPSGEQPKPAGEDIPGSGELRAKLPGETKEIPLPLKHTDVQAAIAGYIATVDVTQQYHNPYESKIEAVYVFPLPENAAVNEFLMTVGERKIRGIIREREEAEKIYQEAKSQGYVASLLTQERPNIFTQSVANIEPGKQIDINIRYFNTLAYDDGWYEFVFPMVVGPRFNPPESTDGVGAVGRGNAGISDQKTEVQYLKPGERSGHDISLSVAIDAGVAIEKIDSRNHVIEVKKLSPEKAEVRLGRLDTVPNKDFVLRYQVAGKTVKSAIITHRDKRGGFFTMMIYPPKDLNNLKRKPMEMIFVLDCSGSMSGRPIEQAKAAAERALRLLEPDDTFQIIRFSNNASQLGPKPVVAASDNVRRGLEYLKSLQGEGGTMMIEGIKAALDFPHDENRLRFVSFLTDGYVGNEAQIFGEIHKRLGAARIFGFGVGSSVNRYLLDGMARMGKGAVAYLGLNDDGADVMNRFFERISHPAMTDVTIDWGERKTSPQAPSPDTMFDLLPELRVTDVYPQRIPDLFVGRPVIPTGRFRGTPDPNRPVRVRGKLGSESREIAVPWTTPDGSTGNAALAAVWARMKIAKLSQQAVMDPGEQWTAQIKTVALEYGLMSNYTAFVTVDSLTRTAGSSGTTFAVPVPVPDGVKYETTVEER